MRRVINRRNRHRTHRPSMGRSHRRAHQGLTLLELMVAMAIGVVLLGMSSGFFTSYTLNARLRESGHLLQNEALYAQSEAVRRNATVRLVIQAASVKVIDLDTEAKPVTLRERQLNFGVAAEPATITFDSRGLPTPLGTGITVALSSSVAECSSQVRCPQLRIEGGGAASLCADRLTCP